MESNTKSLASFEQRCHILNVAAHAVRQQAIRQGNDLAGWRLSRLMRDADTSAQVCIGEQQYGAWRASRDQKIREPK
jgi:hypothetical protein